jgi:hypothetical protein
MRTYGPMPVILTDLYGEWDFEVRMLVPTLMFLYDDALKFTIKTSICCLQEWRKAHFKDWLEMTARIYG